MRRLLVLEPDLTARYLLRNIVPSSWAIIWAGSAEDMLMLLPGSNADLAILSWPAAKAGAKVLAREIALLDIGAFAVGSEDDLPGPERLPAGWEPIAKTEWARFAEALRTIEAEGE